MDHIGVQAELWLFDADKGRRIGGQQYRQQRKPPQRAVRPADERARRLEVLFPKAHLDSSALHVGEEILGILIKHAQGGEELVLDLRRFEQAAEHNTKIRE